MKKKRPSLRAAVNQFCRECIYDPGASGTWREQISACTSPECPLFQVRPGTSKSQTQGYMDVIRGETHGPV